MPRSIIEKPTNLLSLERFCFEVRTSLQALSDEEADAFTDIIGDAVAAVQIDANLPILPTLSKVVLEIRDRDGVINYTEDPYCLNFTGTTSPSAAVFYTDTIGDFRARVFTQPLAITILNEPIQDNAAKGRLTAKAETSLNTYYQINYRRGVFTDHNSVGDLRSLAILRARAIFDGTVSVPERSRSAYERILERVRFEGILPATLENVS